MVTSTKASLLPAVGKWKFWTLGHPSYVAGAVRSFVTSSGTCSLDLGIPSFAKHANLMILECYSKEPPSLVIPIEDFWCRYEHLTLRRNDDEIKKFFISIDPEEIVVKDDGLDDFVFQKNTERFYDLVGKKRLIERCFDGLKTINVVEITPATSPDTITTYVTGHPNPDADSIVSSVFEAARRNVLYGTHCVAWSDRVPPTVAHILGSKICANLLAMPKFGPTHDIVLVDCHSTEEECEYQVKSIIDHHVISQRFPYYVAISQEISWSSTIQVYIKYLGSGLDLDPPSARMLLEATLLEAEPHLMAKMSLLDKLALERLTLIAKWSTSYADLMTRLINEANTPDPFMNDYKQTLYGFAVVKTRSLTCFKARAEANNTENYLPLTIVKQVVYNSQFNTVLYESISLYFNGDFHDKGLKIAILDSVSRACQAFHGSNHVSVRGMEVKVLLLKSHRNADGPSVTLRDQPTAPTTGISFADVTSLLSPATNTSFLSLKQYWEVYKECVSLKHRIMEHSLRNKQYVELLDTVIRNQKEVMHSYDGVFRQADIIEARPALIRPDSIDIRTGFPTILNSPDNYGDPSLWRYWSPDREENVATRGHIFIMNQTSIDMKISRHDTTQNLTFRPSYHDITDLKYDVLSDGGSWVTVKIFPRRLSIS
ncbi:hypothetical protein QQS21_006020 [Conoideocrella luteorostrata]|uniref:DDH domain-containing protein n=1 Tax=Conoideocrella luteorostrata TaxID=1105319 RepID=A0AAJ0CNE0_9HYPO|nr:hypothetical protein QQS21_006020 [Conoideocrella luteorostrata]